MYHTVTKLLTDNHGSNDGNWGEGLNGEREQISRKIGFVKYSVLETNCRSWVSFKLFLPYHDLDSNFFYGN